MTKIVSLWEFSGSSARFGISEVLRISPRFYGYIRTCSIITKLCERQSAKNFLKNKMQGYLLTTAHKCTNLIWSERKKKNFNFIK
jgi:hypothetical protein